MTVPALLDLPVIQRTPASVSNISSSPGLDGGVDLSEGCLITKAIKYTHQLAHWVNAVPDKFADCRLIEEVISRDLRIVPDENFTLDDPCNLAYLEAFVHTSLDLYAFIAVTASLPTLDDLLQMVKSDNDRRQRMLDETGIAPTRLLDFSLPSVANPEYELIALHPEHFLPRGAVLTIYSPGDRSYKNYIAASDRSLRESPDPNSPRLPPFRHNTDDREVAERINIFLVILNADIKFRRYIEMIRRDPPPLPLPDDVTTLMQRTADLVDLLYWRPLPAKGSKGETIAARIQASRNSGRAARADPAVFIEKESSEEVEMEDAQDDDVQTLGSPQSYKKKTPTDFWTPERRRRELQWLASADLEARKAYGRALMSGHDRDYDPALFEDAFPLGDACLYSESAAVEAWKEGVKAEGSGLKHENGTPPPRSSIMISFYTSSCRLRRHVWESYPTPWLIPPTGSASPSSLSTLTTPTPHPITKLPFVDLRDIIIYRSVPRAINTTISVTPAGGQRDFSLERSASSPSLLVQRLGAASHSDSGRRAGRRFFNDLLLTHKVIAIAVLRSRSAVAMSHPYSSSASYIYANEVRPSADTRYHHFPGVQTDIYDSEPQGLSTSSPSPTERNVAGGPYGHMRSLDPMDSVVSLPPAWPPPVEAGDKNNKKKARTRRGGVGVGVASCRWSSDSHDLTGSTPTVGVHLHLGAKASAWGQAFNVGPTYFRVISHPRAERSLEPWIGILQHRIGKVLKKLKQLFTIAGVRLIKAPPRIKLPRPRPRPPRPPSPFWS
ncbi:hypothetical protein D9615_009468 [Tricholomella constricta]|uniref:Uncharacterized protein n=1 Tax=Tricholomella constricta TaxID=117010 RepID=A0A8H5GYF4_9AGAR|nr:hypothetical protein D9615_009468 [Tricholomella constricta]